MCLGGGASGEREGVSLNISFVKFLSRKRLPRYNAA
jgi:hypothetical protein